MANDVRRLLELQHGILSRQMLRDAGFTRGQIDRLIRDRRLIAVSPGVYAAPGADLSHPMTRCRAALLRGGSGATLSHESAAWVWGLLRAPEATQAIHVSIPMGRSRVGMRGVILHHRRRMAHVVRWGLPVRPALETLVDLTAHLPVDELRFPVMTAMRTQLLTIADLDHVAGLPRNSSARWRMVAQEARAGAWSGTEATYWRGLVDSRLPLPSLNVAVSTDDGVRIADALWPRYFFAVEVDGAEFHDRPDAFERDRVKDWSLFADQGLVTLRVTAKQVRDRLAWVIDRTGQALAQRCQELNLTLRYRRPGSLPTQLRR